LLRLSRNGKITGGDLHIQAGNRQNRAGVEGMVGNPGEESRSTTPQALFEEAVAHHQRGDHKGAIKLYRHLMSEGPDHPQVLNMCATATAEIGDFPEAAQLLEKAVQLDPTFNDGWANLGLVHQELGNHAAAAKAYDQYRSLDPASPVGHLNFANICQILKRFDDAATAYEQALAITPDNSGIWGNLARACLHLGNWEKTIEAANRTLALSPGNTGALAIKSAALAELGKSKEVAELVDFDRLIQANEFAAPEGYADLKVFNDALCAHCLAHPSLSYEPGENTTMKGHQTGNLSLDKEQGPIEHLLAMIDGAVRKYQATHPVDTSHHFLAQRPNSWKYDIWATVLGSQGHQAPHIHRSGWLSGCYYAKIPDVIAADSMKQDGWIEFGRPQGHPMSKAEPQLRSYPPHEGMVVLFPSYFYHRTEPFESQDKRISIAFDIIPIS
jgi:uncharacterized protein (TIGR02466 family)